MNGLSPASYPSRRGRPATRREWLLTAGAAAAVVASEALVRQRAAPTSAPPRFAGDPGQGRLYYGATVSWHRDLHAWEERLGHPLTVNRTYFGPDQVLEMLYRVRLDHAQGRLPFVSTQCPGTWALFANGGHDAWLQDLLDGLAATEGPVFLALHHEPEQDAGYAGMDAADWVAMQTRAIAAARDLADNVTVVPVLTQRTFDRRSGRRPDNWLVPSADVLGIDVYNDWSLRNGQPWAGFADLMEDVRSWTGGLPIAVAEYGTRSPLEDPERGADWLREAFTYALSNDIVCLAYYNSYVNALDGSWELDGPRERAFAELLAHADVHAIRA